MYFIKKWILRKIFKFLKKKPTDMPMVEYWKKSDSIGAAITRDDNGAIIMKMGSGDKKEKYVFPGYPRGHLLFGTLSKLKHEIKNQIFNQSWAMLEEGKNHAEIIDNIKGIINGGIPIKDNSTLAGREYMLGEKCLDIVKYDMVPWARMSMPVKEIWRAFTRLEEKSKGSSQKSIKNLKEIITYILQEDDAYRFRFQWMIGIFNPSAWWFKILFRDPVKDFELALDEMVHAEILGDMKGRIRLLKRILMLFLEDKNNQKLFREFCKEVDWNKVKMSEADKYHFRGKYFKVDLDRFEY